MPKQDRRAGRSTASVPTPAALTWEQLKQTKEGTILHDAFDEGLRFIILRGPGSLCAYIGIPLEHPLAGFSYDDLPITAHGGLTYSGPGDKYRPEGFYWYGWDYHHSGDAALYEDKYPSLKDHNDQRWLVKDVIDDSWEAIYELKQLMHLIEKVVNKLKEAK